MLNSLKKIKVNILKYIVQQVFHVVVLYANLYLISLMKINVIVKKISIISIDILIQITMY